MATIARHRVDVVTHPGWFTPPPPAVAVLPHVAAGVRGPRRHQQRGGERVAPRRRRRPRERPAGRVRRRVRAVRAAAGGVHAGPAHRRARVQRGGEDLESVQAHRARPRRLDARRRGVRDGDDVRGVLRLPRLRRPRRGVLLCARGAVHRRRRASRAQDALAGDVLPLHPARSSRRRDVRGRRRRRARKRARAGVALGVRPRGRRDGARGALLPGVRAGSHARRGRARRASSKRRRRDASRRGGGG